MGRCEYEDRFADLRPAQTEPVKSAACVDTCSDTGVHLSLFIAPTLVAFILASTVLPLRIACAEERSTAAENEGIQIAAIHAQATFVEQGNRSFRSPYTGRNSLNPANVWKQTFDFTVFMGVRPWAGAEFWLNPEIDQGFGLSDTLGVAGFPSGEAYKIGQKTPYLRLQRAFVRQTFDLDGPVEPIAPAANQLGGHRSANRFVITAGKLSVPDIFDANQYAHDTRGDFLNWTALDTGSFDYAADAWGYTVGLAAEWYQGTWTWRVGVFDLSDVPNSEKLDSHFRQFQIDAEIEKRYEVAGQTGKVLVTGFQSRGRMGRYDDAISRADATGIPADIQAVRRYRDRAGISFTLEQALTGNFGVFARGGVANGNVEPYEFTDVDRTIAAGFSATGMLGKRPKDTLGLTAIVNAISAGHQRFLNAGGLGILVGDGRLPHPGSEHVFETYYATVVKDWVNVSFDYQFISHPAYNRDRGPVSIFGLRLHSQF